MFGGFGGVLPLRLTPDTTTGWSAAQHSRGAADLVSLKRCSPLAVLTITSSASGGGTQTLHDCWSMIEIGTVSEFAPYVARSSAGVIIVRFEPRFLDEYDISAPFNIRHAKVTPHGSTALKANAEIMAPNEVWVRIFDSSGVATDGKVTLTVC